MKTEINCTVCSGRGREIIRNNIPMLICDSCGLFWRVSFELPKGHYETRDFELNNIGKEKARYSNSVDRIKLLKRYADFNNLCDVGCGEGVFLKAARDMGYQNIIGLEPSREAREFAVHNNLKIIEGSIENLDKTFFEKNNIHTVTMFHVIEHLEDPRDALKTIFDNIKKGDKLIIETPDTNSYILRKTNYNHELIYLEHLHYFNKNNIQKLLKDIGFNIISLGNRDFDSRNMSISESLMRLGLIKKERGTIKIKSSVDKKTVQFSSNNRSLIKGIIRIVLSKIVSFLRRGDYLWIVAEKK